MCALQDFMNSKPRNAWLEVGQFQIYVRKGHHVLGGEMVKTLDFANLDTNCEEEAKFLDFYKLLRKLEKTADEYGLVLHIENVLNPKLFKMYNSLPRYRREGICFWRHG